MEMVATRSGRVGSLPVRVEASPGTEMDMVRGQFSEGDC